MKITPEKAKEMITVVAIFGLTFLFFPRLAVLSLPFFLIYLFRSSWKVKQWEEDDPADWWKKKGRNDPTE